MAKPDKDAITKKDLDELGQELTKVIRHQANRVIILNEENAHIVAIAIGELSTQFRGIKTLLQTLETLTKGLDMKVSELAGVIDAINTAVEKVKTEVQALKDSLGDVDLPQAAEEALARLTAAVKSVDDINPDAT